MAQTRSVFPGIFSLPIDLRQAEHRRLEFAGQPFQTAGDLGDLFLTWITRIVGFDQLQVVDHDQSQATFTPLDATSSRSNLGDGAAGRVVDEQLGLAHLTGDGDQAPTLVLRERPVPEPVSVDPTDAAEQPVGQLHGGHFQADE